MFVIRILGKQYQVSEGDEVVVDVIDEKSLPTAEVLAEIGDKKITLGEPVLTKLKVAYKVIEQVREDKIRVFKYKSKSRERKTTGFVPKKTRIKITKIGA